MKALRPRLQRLDTRTAMPAASEFDDFYRSPAWRRLVARLIAERGRACERCDCRDGRIVGDHIVELRDGGARLDPENVRLLCHRCHERKTAAARAARLGRRPPGEADQPVASATGRHAAEEGGFA